VKTIAPAVRPVTSAAGFWLVQALALPACTQDRTPAGGGPAQGSAKATSPPSAHVQAPAASGPAHRTANKASAPPEATSNTARASLPLVATAETPLRLRLGNTWIPAARAARILHAGDSMVPLVGNYLRRAVWDDKRDYWIEARDSSTTRTWAQEGLLRKAMYQYDPQVVLITLGSNELFDPTPEDRAQDIRQLVRDTRNRPCLWIAPPLWKKDRGFIRVLKANLGHCLYFDTNQLDLPRMEDGRHPDWSGGYKWALGIWHALGGVAPIPKNSAKTK